MPQYKVTVRMLAVIRLNADDETQAASIAENFVDDTFEGFEAEDEFDGGSVTTRMTLSAESLDPWERSHVEEIDD